MTCSTLYDRMGGDLTVQLLIACFFDEVCEDEYLKPFFKNISVSALANHQLKLFRVIFGPEEERPDHVTWCDYMLATHCRLFRDLGLDETHFDKFAEAFVRALQTMHMEECVLQECVNQLLPLRAVFEHGAKVAAKEKTYSKEYLETLPLTTASHVGTDTPSVLPNPVAIDIPCWLTETLKRYSNNGEIRAWTKDMTDRFAPAMDKVVADTFMDVPYMNYHIYIVAMLQLAFLPESSDPTELINIVRYPRGPNENRLCIVLWQRLLVHFGRTCKAMGLRAEMTDKALQKLQSYAPYFSKRALQKVGGADTPHILRRTVVNPNPAFDVTQIVGKTFPRSSSSSVGTASVSSTKSPGSRRPRKIKGVWRRMFGWTKVR